MKSFIASTALVALCISNVAQAHTTFTNFFVNGVNQGDGKCVRMNKDPSKATFPVEDLASKDMACGFSGTQGVERVCPAEGGAQVSFEFRARPDISGSTPIDPSHKGPCAVYMKKVDSAIKDTAAGDGWFKIWDDGYDASAKKWCTEKLIDDKGHLTVDIPADLAGGYYLIRPELLALHSATQGDPQFYIGCAQVYLQSNGTSQPKETVSIPGYVKTGSPPVSYNIYEQPLKLPYPMYGPPAYKGGKATGNAGATQAPQKEGLKKPNTVLENGNWCGTEVSKYSDEQGCWNTGKACWNQNDACWKDAPSSGGANCKVWQTKCQNINNQCQAKNFQGPPDYMKILTPKPPSPQLPPPRKGVDGVSGSVGGSQAPSPAKSYAGSSPAPPKKNKVADKVAGGKPPKISPKPKPQPKVDVKVKVVTKTIYA